MVPEGWTIPATNIKDSWNLWYFGLVGDGIRPLRYLKKMDLVGDSQITLWTKTNGLVNALSEAMVQMQLAGISTIQDVTRLSQVESLNYFDQAIVQFMEKMRPGSTQTRNRWMELSVGSLYTVMSKARKRARENEDEVE